MNWSYAQALGGMQLRVSPQNLTAAQGERYQGKKKSVQWKFTNIAIGVTIRAIFCINFWKNFI
jgi:hypothetical protein